MRREGRLRAGVLLLAALLLPACGQKDKDWETASAITGGGNPARGKAVIAGYGCKSCHTIPGVEGANSLVGPPLTGFAGRAYIAGVLPNTPDNLIRWIVDPPAVDSLTAMPNLHVTARQARDVASYLYTLK